MSIEVRLGAERFRTETEGRSTLHSFSFGTHYDPANLGFGAMIALNDETLPPGTGYPDHGHRDTEIVTWVLEGALRHTDAVGNTGVLLAGDVQRISAGAGIVHAETTEPGVRTRFLQTWLRPDEPGGEPSYEVGRALAPPRGLVEAVGTSGLVIGTTGARLLVGVCEPGELVLPDADRLHVFVVDGRAVLGERALEAGDAARLTGEGDRSLRLPTAATLAVWAFGT